MFWEIGNFIEHDGADQAVAPSVRGGDKLREGMAVCERTITDSRNETSQRARPCSRNARGAGRARK